MYTRTTWPTGTSSSSTSEQPSLGCTVLGVNMSEIRWTDKGRGPFSEMFRCVDGGNLGSAPPQWYISDMTQKLKNGRGKEGFSALALLLMREDLPIILLGVPIPSSSVPTFGLR